MQALGIVRRLCVTTAQSLHRRFHQRADVQIAFLRFFRQASIGQKQRHPVRLAAVHQIRPDFGFHQNAKQRAVFFKKLLNISRLVVGQITALHIGKQRARRFAAGWRHLRHQNRRFRKKAAQFAHQRQRRTGFPHRYCMYPNRFLYRTGERLAETLVPMRQIRRIFFRPFTQIAPD